MATATAPVPTAVLEDRFDGVLFVEGEATESYDNLNNVLFDIAQAVARREHGDAVGDVVEELHAAIRELTVRRIQELGLAR